VRADLFPIWRGGKAGYRYDVAVDGEVLVERSRDPEHDLAGVLLARGITGKVQIHDGNTGKPRTVVDVEKAAGLMVIEEDRGGLRLRKYREVGDVFSQSRESAPVHTTTPADREAA
jgi:hypothetical protein